jgi:hypothetical protein
MRKLTAAVTVTFAALVITGGVAAPASAATKNAIISVKVAYGDACGDDATLVTTVKLRKGHNAADLATDLYAGKRWVGSRKGDVHIGGKTAVKFATCVPYKALTDRDGNPRTDMRLTVRTMPRSRFEKSVRVPPIPGD